MTSLRGAALFGFEHAYDRRDGRHARRVLATIERQSGRRVSPESRRAADRYAKRVLGSSRFSPWLVVYSAVAGEFREGWIPDNFYGRIVAPNINRAIRHIAEIKSLSRTVFRSDAFPDVAYLIDGVYYDRAHRRVDAASIGRVIFESADEVIVKSDRSRQGNGVSPLRVEVFDPVATAAAFRNAVFQRRILQHPHFDKYSPASSTTLRVTTVRTERGGPEARAAYLRFAGEGDAFVLSANHVRVPIDAKTGCSAEVGYLADWSRVERHPASGTRFARATVPAFDQAIARCTELHDGLPHAGAIGWDLMIDSEEEVWVLEWNAKHNDIKFSEATTGPCFTGLGWERLKPVRGTWLI